MLSAITCWRSDNPSRAAPSTEPTGSEMPKDTSGLREGRRRCRSVGGGEQSLLRGTCRPRRYPPEWFSKPLLFSGTHVDVHRAVHACRGPVDPFGEGMLPRECAEGGDQGGPDAVLTVPQLQGAFDEVRRHRSVQVRLVPRLERERRRLRGHLLGTHHVELEPVQRGLPDQVLVLVPLLVLLAGDHALAEIREPAASRQTTRSSSTMSRQAWV